MTTWIPTMVAGISICISCTLGSDVYLDPDRFELRWNSNLLTVDLAKALEFESKLGNDFDNWPNDFKNSKKNALDYWSKVSGSKPEDWVVVGASLKITKDSKPYFVLYLSPNIIASGVHSEIGIFFRMTGQVIEYEQ